MTLTDLAASAVGGVIYLFLAIFLIFFLIPAIVKLVQVLKNPVHFHGVPSEKTACFKKHKVST